MASKPALPVSMLANKISEALADLDDGDGAGYYTTRFDPAGRTLTIEYEAHPTASDYADATFVFRLER